MSSHMAVLTKTLIRSLRYRGFCPITRVGTQGWAHRFPDGTIVTSDLSAYPPRKHASDTLEFFLWGCSLRDGDTVLDLGAGVGEECVTFSKLVGPIGRVVSVEAHPRTYSLLVEAIRRNRLDNVVAVHAAVAGSEGDVEMSDEGTSVANRVGMRGIKVPGIPLSVAAQGLDEITLLKMNIEGAEADALESASDVLARTRNVVVSCHDFLGSATATRVRVQRQLVAAGFSVSSRPDHHLPAIRDYLYASREPSA